MPASLFKNPLPYLALFIFWALIYLPGVGSHEIRGEEWRRVLPARTMIQTGDWLVPYSGGKTYLRKPPLINWTTALSFQITGRQTEFTARIPSLLLMLAAAWGVFAFSRRIMSQEAAFVGTLFFITSIGTMEKGRIAELEVYYIAFTALAYASWMAGFLGRLNRWAAWLWAGLFLGLAFLAKGPAHLLFFYAIVIGAWVRTRRFSEVWSAPHLAGLAVFLGIILAWGLPFLSAYSEIEKVPVSDIFEYWQKQVTSRTDSEDGPGMDVMLARPPKALVMFLPWILLAPLWWRRKLLDSALGSDLERRAFSGAVWGVVISFLVMILLPGATARYVAPLLGPAALLTGWIAVTAFEGAFLAFKIWRGVIGVLATALFLTSGYLAFRTGDVLAWSIILGSAAVLWCVWKSCSTTSQTVVGYTGYTAVLCALGLAGVVVVERNGLAGTDRVRPVSLEIRAAAQPEDSPIYVYRVGQTPYPFYFGQDAVEVARLSQLPRTGVRWMVTVPAGFNVDKADLEARYGKVESIQEFERTWGASQKGQKILLVRFPGRDTEPGDISQ